ncbi:FAD-binding oxidoreductase [Aliamphritea spongicola]|nr:FAD-binding oxidoreductase [Aliamphritea spongicola]
MQAQYCDNYYANSLNGTTDYPRLEGEHQVDVAIVGGGFTGVATAVELAEKGYKVAIIEANKIGWGATGRNGGQVTGSLSGDKALLKQLVPKMGKAGKTLSGTCAGGAMKSLSPGWKNTVSSVTLSTGICTLPISLLICRNWKKVITKRWSGAWG